MGNYFKTEAREGLNRVLALVCLSHVNNRAETRPEGALFKVWDCWLERQVAEGFLETEGQWWCYT